MNPINRRNPIISVYAHTDKVNNISADIFDNMEKTQTSIWFKKLNWFFTKRWRTTLILINFDTLAVWFGIIVVVLYNKFILGVQVTVNHFIDLWIYYNFIIFLYFFLKNGYGNMRYRRSDEELAIIVSANFWAILMVFAVNFIFLQDLVFSRFILILGFMVSVCFMLIFRFVIREVMTKLWKYGLAKENVLFVGYSVENIERFLKHLNIQRYAGYNIIGYLSGNVEREEDNFKYLGGLENLSQVIINYKVDKVVLSIDKYSDKNHQMLVDYLVKCQKYNIPAMIISQIFNEYNYCLSLDGYTNLFIIDYKIPAHKKLFTACVKRSLDIIGGLFFLLCTLPIWVFVAIAIKIEDGGPVLFRRRVVGKGSKPFDALKFRTMVNNAQDILKNNPALLADFKKNHKLINDPRVTRVGKWLRKTSLDELPQMFNILKGDMSLVGPRIITEQEQELYGEFKYERAKIRPGLTGFWQVNGRSTIGYEERIEMDKFYLNKYNIWLDLMILMKTPIKVILCEGSE